MPTIDLVVAKAHIAGGVKVTREATDTIRAQPGSKLLVKFPYRFDELSREEESWKVRLEARLGRQTARPAEKIVRDKRGTMDDERGFVQHAFDLDRGEHTLAFTASAEFRQGPWDGPPGDTAAEEVEGEIKVIVEDW